VTDARLVIAVIVGGWALVYLIIGAAKAAVGLFILAAVLMLVALLDRLTLGKKPWL
jgi:hypothetical protein